MVEEKVVPFQRKSSSAAIEPSEARQLGDTCRKLTLAYLKELMQQMFDTADDTLFKLAGTSVNDMDQGLYFDSMRIMRFKRNDIEEAFFNQVSDAFREFWVSTPHEDSGEFIITDELSLIEEQDLEEDLAIKNLIRKIRSNYQQDISAIEQRLSEIVTNKKIDASNNPLGPETFCKAFQYAARELNTDIKIKLILFKLFDFHINGNIGTHYHNINDTFIQAGVLPQLKLKVRNNNTTTGSTHHSGNSAPSESDKNTYPGTAQEGVLTAFQHFRQQPGPSLGSPALSNPGNPLTAYHDNNMAAGVLTSEILIANLTPLQEQFQAGVADCSVNAINQQVKQAISSSNPTQQINPIDNDIIDLVSMLFEFVLDDKHIPATARSSIARLQIPIIKAAILDKEFFNINGHPARKLLNSLAHAGLDLPSEDEDSLHPALLAIQDAVDKIIRDFNNDLAIFTSVLEEFEQALEAIYQNNQHLEEESLQPFYKKEEYRLASQWVSETIQNQIYTKELPEPFTSLLLGAWKNVMLDTYLEKGPQSPHWKNQQRFIDILCWSIEPKFATQDRKKLGNILRFIIETLNEGLAQIETPEENIEKIIKALEPYHYASLHGRLLTEDDDYVDGVFQSDVQDIQKDSLADSIEQLQAAINELPDIDIMDMDDSDSDKQLMENIVLEGFDQGERSEVFPDDEYLELARHLEAGKWVEFTDDDQQTTRARLAWKSDLLGEFTFLNWKFDVIADKKLFELANDFRIGKAKVIDDLPLIDRAFSAIMNRLQGTAATA